MKKLKFLYLIMFTFLIPACLFAENLSYKLFTFESDGEGNVWAHIPVTMGAVKAGDIYNVELSGIPSDDIMLIDCSLDVITNDEWDFLGGAGGLDLQLKKASGKTDLKCFIRVENTPDPDKEVYFSILLYGNTKSFSIADFDISCELAEALPADAIFCSKDYYDNNTYFSARLLRMKNKEIKKGHTYLVTINATASEDAVIDAVAFALNGDTWKDLGGDWHRSEAVQKDLPFSITFNCPVHTKPGKKDEVDVWVRFLASPDSTITDLILSNIEVTWTDAAKAAKKSRRD